MGTLLASSVALLFSWVYKVNVGGPFVISLWDSVRRSRVRLKGRKQTEPLEILNQRQYLRVSIWQSFIRLLRRLVLTSWVALASSTSNQSSGALHERQGVVRGSVSEVSSLEFFGVSSAVGLGWQQIFLRPAIVVSLWLPRETRRKKRVHGGRVQFPWFQDVFQGLQQQFERLRRRES